MSCVCAPKVTWHGSPPDKNEHDLPLPNLVLSDARYWKWDGCRHDVSCEVAIALKN